MGIRRRIVVYNNREKLLAYTPLAVEIPSDDPCPDLPIELGPEEKGVGSWVPAEKHRLVCKYLHVTRNAWKAWPRRVLLDPFCGPGRIRVKGETFTRDGGAIVAARQMRMNGAEFTDAFVGDLNPDRVRACSDRMTALGFKVRAFPGCANDTVVQMVDIAKKERGTLFFAYVDPYNLALLDFEMLKRLASLPNVDLLVHFSTMDLLRNVEVEFDRLRFDSVAPGWRDAIPVDKLPKSELFGQFLRYWMGKVERELKFSSSRECPLIPNDSGREIYRLVFFARNPLPIRIWGDVARGPQRDLGF